jgi:hypothetical protein
LRFGGPERSGELMEPDAEPDAEPDTKPKPGLLALLEDDIRQSLAALSGELKRLRGKIRPSLERHQDEEVLTSASPESVKSPDR